MTPIPACPSTRATRRTPTAGCNHGDGSREGPPRLAHRPARAARETPGGSASIRAFLDGSPVEVSRATLAPGYIGFYLIEVQLPAIMNAGVSELHIAAAGQESTRADRDRAIKVGML